MKLEIKLLNEVECQFINAPDDLIIFFHKKYTYKVEGAAFLPQVRLGIWDGKTSLFSKSGVTYITFLEDIFPILLEIGMSPVLIDERKKPKPPPVIIDENYFAHIIHPTRNKPVILRSYQVDSVNSLISSRTGMVIAGTGAGKTFITAAICKSYNDVKLRAIIIVPDTYLCMQTYDEFVMLGLDTGRFVGDFKEPDHDTLVATWQSLQHNPHLLLQFDMVVIDECQGAKSKVLHDMIKIYAPHMRDRFGVTATLPKDELGQRQIKGVLGVTKHEIPSHELIKMGVLSTINIHIEQLSFDFQQEYEDFLSVCLDEKPPTYAKWKGKMFKDYAMEKQFLRGNMTVLRHMVDRVYDLAQTTGSVFFLVDSIPMGKKLLKMFPEGSNVHFTSGNKKINERQEIYNLFENNDDVIVMATVHSAGTGVSIDRIFNVVMFDLGKSFIRILQALGRGLRKGEGKDHVDAFDICFDTKYSKSHLSKRIKYYKDAQYPYQKSKINL
jgi:superfamily II DNA or RNA helicase